MLKGHDVIYFSNDWQTDNRTSSHHIARQLGKANRVLYVESGGLRAPKASAHDIGRIFKKLGKWMQGIRHMEENVYVITPLMLPLHSWKAVRRLNSFLLAHMVKRACRKLKMEQPILWIIIPHMATLAERLKHKLLVYYCVDDFSSLPGVESSAIGLYDRKLTEIADIIFTSSKPLYDKKKAVNENTFLSPHGVDFAHFSKVYSENLMIPEDVRVIKKPIIGFFGLIENWIDLELVKYICQRRPDWSIAMIGRVVKNISIFNRIPNIYFLGPRPYKLLPDYAKAFDVAIIPYILNQQVYNANPIKLREYLATGKPVVSVRSPEIEKFADVIAIANTYEEFVSNVDASLKNDSSEMIRSRIERVSDSSWEKRFEDVSFIVNSYLEKK